MIEEGQRKEKGRGRRSVGEGKRKGIGEGL